MPRSVSFIATLTILAMAASGTASAAVFINELHYDNAGDDAREAVEVVATAGETLSGYRIALYNGSSAADAATLYAGNALPASTAVSCGGSARIAVLTYPANGLQNGSSDGVALIDAAGRVKQFISYEGAITAADGPAAGSTSISLPVSESNATAAGTSLQLSGRGVDVADFRWAAGKAQSFGSCNAGQTFSGSAVNVAPTLVSTTPTAGSSTFPPAGDLVISFSEPVTAAIGAFRLTCGSASNAPIALTGATQATVFSLSPARTLVGDDRCTLSIDATKITDADGARPATIAPISFQVAKGNGGGSGYYGRVNASSPQQLRCSLHETIKGHTAYPYSGSGTSTWSILEIADEDPADPDRVVDIYRNHSYAKVRDRAGSGTGLTYNREHAWPNSLGFGTASGDKGLPYAPYTDTHMLYLSDTTFNSDRGNKPYADCGSGCGERASEARNGRGGGSGVYPGNSNWVRSPDGNGGSFETWGQRRGDVARAVMYMAIRYEGGVDARTGQSEPDLELTDDRSKIVKTSASPAYMGLLSTLLAWSQADPPDQAERARNEVIFSFQGNRNPFIDHPEWATRALLTSTRPASCQLSTGVAASER